MKEDDEMVVKPIRFSGVFHHGRPGVKGENAGQYLERKIRQNIIYSVYREAKTISEISRDLKTPASYIEDEIKELEENSLLEKVSGNKYLTNVLIYEPTKEILEQKHKIYTEYAKEVCNIYIPLLMKAIKTYDRKMIYTPVNDFNFLLWSVVSFACGFKLVDKDKHQSLNKYLVKRNDGGENIAVAWLDKDIKWDELDYMKKLSDVFLEMRCFNTDRNISWQFNTFHDCRKLGWQDNLLTDYTSLYEYMTGQLSKDASNAFTYKRLYDKRFLIPVKNGDYVNVVVVRPSEIEFLKFLPDIPSKLITIGKKLDKAIHQIDKTQFPERFHELSLVWCSDLLTSSDLRIRVIEQLLKEGILKPLKKKQKYTVNTIMFSDVLPHT